MNSQRNVNSILRTELSHKFSYIVATFIHNHFESPNSRDDEDLSKIIIAVAKEWIMRHNEPWIPQDNNPKVYWNGLLDLRTRIRSKI
jgi:hypothetical protein